MHHQYRQAYNRLLTPSKYEDLYREVTRRCGVAPSFRLCETPIFVDADLWEQLRNASRQLLDFVSSDNFLELSEGAIFPGTKVPKETPHPHMIAMDFGICELADGSIAPRLIEMQGFPTVFGFQYQLFKSYQTIMPETSHLSPFMEMSEDQYLDTLAKMLGRPNTILMDITPELQNTYVDFSASERLFGIPSVCVSDIKKSGKKLYYTDEQGRDRPIDYIFNRVIFDELLTRDDLSLHFSFFEDLDVQWISHPNWYFRISKYIMPFLDFDFVPLSFFVSDLKEVPDDLENFVLKPLFSFSGQGVKMDVVKEDIDSIVNKHEWMLQEKVAYAPVIQAPDGRVKCEVRVMALWPDELEEPIISFNVVRMTKGAMVGVKYNKNKAWVGSSIALRVPS